LLTYEHQKPLKAAYHEALAAWVRDGGCLLFVDDGKDPYHTVREWWNEQGTTNLKAADHLLSTLGVDKKVWDGTVAIGKGYVRCIAASPAKLTYEKDGADKVREWVKELLALRGESLKMTPGICIRRGPYVIASVFNESPLADSSMTLRGRFVDLFDPSFPVITEKVLQPNQRTFLYDIDKRFGPAVLAASTRAIVKSCSSHAFVFTTRGPLGTTARMRVFVPEPKSITIEPAMDYLHTRDNESKTSLIEMPNTAGLVQVTIAY
jgi:hypothetical protein